MSQPGSWIHMGSSFWRKSAFWLQDWEAGSIVSSSHSWILIQQLWSFYPRSSYSPILAISDGEAYASPDSRNRIPSGFYGDAAQLITKARIEKLLCFFNIVVFRPRSTRYSRFLLWSCDSSLIYKNRTANSILRWLVWSFNALYEGKYPVARPGNRPLEAYERDLAGQWLTHKRLLLQVVELRGDWEFQKLIWQFKCSWKGGVNVGICYHCPAMGKCGDAGLYYWNEDDENSSWARQEFNTTEYLAERLKGCKGTHLVIQHAPYYKPYLGFLCKHRWGQCFVKVGILGTWLVPATTLDKAYQDFIVFCRAHKLDQSQPPFKESKAPWLNFIVYTRLDSITLVLCI